MKFILSNSDGIVFSQKSDLAKVVPAELSGRALNYGQGEGQVEIAETVWGFYVNSSGGYYMVFEEGEIEWVRMKCIVDAIESKLKSEFGIKVSLIAEGPFTNDPSA